jgi:Arc/MetJ-type ribon-helix-helix transcriptional regulator
MPRLTVTISEEHEQILEERSDVGAAYRSKSEVVRECIESYERVEELSNQLSCLEAEVETLRDQREQLQQKAARVDELEEKLWDLQMEYQELIHEEQSGGGVEGTPTVDEEIAVQRPGLGQRLRAALFGDPDGNR